MNAQDAENRLLEAYLAGFDKLTEAERREMGTLLEVVTLPKGSMLLREGEIASRCYFVLKGCVRQYHLADGEEKTTAFFTENRAVVDFMGYTQQVPGKHFWVCLEPCTLLVGDQASERRMYERFPALEAITRNLMAQDYGRTQEAFAEFIASSPEQRYRRLLETEPALFQRVPQRLLAGYLGISPESLSRIRKRILGKD